jgi:hypothetical protein
MWNSPPSVGMSQLSGWLSPTSPRRSLRSRIGIEVARRVSSSPSDARATASLSHALSIEAHHEVVARLQAVDERALTDLAIGYWLPPHGRRPARERPSGVRRILLPFTGQAISRRSFEAAIRLAKAENATIMPAFLARVPRDCGTTKRR